MELLYSSNNSKFYKLRKLNVKLNKECRLVVGKYLVEHINHLQGLAFAFQLSPLNLLYEVSGIYCYFALAQSRTVPTILDVPPFELISRDIAFIIYKSLVDENENVLNQLQSLFNLDIYTLGGHKLCRYLLSDLNAPSFLYLNCLSKLNSSIDNEFIGLVFDLKSDPNLLADVLIHYVPELQCLSELHLYILNTILELIPQSPTNIAALIHLYLTFECIDHFNKFKLASYCWFYSIAISDFKFENIENIDQYFSDDVHVNQYVLFLIVSNKLEVSNQLISKIVPFIMTLESWPFFFKSLLLRIQFLIGNTNDFNVAKPTPVDASSYHLTILNHCQSWLINHKEPLRHGYLIQSTLKILQDYYTLDLSDLLKPYLNTNFKSHKTHATNLQLESLISKITENNPNYYYKLLLELYLQWVDVLPLPFYSILEDILVFYYFKSVTRKSHSLGSLLDLLPQHVLTSVYFKCKFKFASEIDNGDSFYDYFADLSKYFEIFKNNNKYEALFIQEYLVMSSSANAQSWKWLMSQSDTNLHDFKNGLFCSSLINLQEWEPLENVIINYNNCVLALNDHSIEYPLDAATLKFLDFSNFTPPSGYICAALKSCRIQNMPLFITSIPDAFNAQLTYIKYSRYSGHVAVALNGLNRLLPLCVTNEERTKVKLEQIKINILFKLDESANILAAYKSLTNANPDVYKKLGDYCNQLYTDGPNDQLGLEIINYYATYLRQHQDEQKTMIPRIITLVMNNNIITSQGIQQFLDLCESNKFIHILPHVTLLLSFLMTSNPIFYKLIFGLINGLLNHWHKRIGWYILQSCYSSNPERSKLMHQIVRQFCKREQCGSWMNVQVQTCQYLIRLSDMVFNKQTTEIFLSKECRKLAKLINLDLYLPLKSVFDTTRTDLVTILKFDDHITLLSSLVRPKKMKIHGSDGLEYNFLLKKDEDLRKDQRYLEIASFVNRRFNKNKQTKQRHLHLKTYNVVVLNEINGLIEWMNNTETLRKIITTTQKQKDMKVSMSKIKQRLDLPNKKQEFELILQEIPPVLHLYFCNLFPCPMTYFENRMAFARTTAAMSIVGYALGLGDRHCENILINVTNGDLVHVDFNCLFEKGKRLSVPELVPFRLTQNIVRVFGATGVEGPFRKACELTLEILRKQYYLVDNILESFLNDPLMEWQNQKSHLTPAEQGQLKLNQVKNRVFGVGQGIPLSVEGTVHRAIEEATSSDNLSQMYLGWMAYF